VVPPAGFEPATLGLKGCLEHVRGRSSVDRLNSKTQPRTLVASAKVRQCSSALLSKLLSTCWCLCAPRPLEVRQRLAAEVTTIRIQPVRTDDRHLANILR